MTERRDQVLLNVAVCCGLNATKGVSASISGHNICWISGNESSQWLCTHETGFILAEPRQKYPDTVSKRRIGCSVELYFHIVRIQMTSSRLCVLLSFISSCIKHALNSLALKSSLSCEWEQQYQEDETDVLEDIGRNMMFKDQMEFNSMLFHCRAVQAAVLLWWFVAAPCYAVNRLTCSNEICLRLEKGARFRQC